MNAPLISLVNPLLVLALMILSVILPALLLRVKRENGARVPRNYIEEIRDFVLGAEVEKPKHAVEVLFAAIGELTNANDARLRVWRVLLTGRASKAMPTSIYRRLLNRFIVSWRLGA